MDNTGVDSSEQNEPGFQPTRFVKPEYEGNSIANIPESAASILGLASARCLRDERITRYNGVENVVLLLLDGLGSSQVEYSREKFGVPSFEKNLSHALQFQITSVFPSTTSSAMSSLHTGLTPQEHGIIGYTMFLGELGTIGQMLRFFPVQGGRSLFDLGLDPEKFFDARTIHERLNAGGISSTVYVPRNIIDSGLSRITYRGAKIEPQISFSDMMVRVRKNLEKRNSNSFHFAYHPSPDTIAHAYGTNTEEYAAELESIFHLVDLQLFQKLDRATARKTVFIVSGDHGAVEVPGNQILDVGIYPDLIESLRVPPTGDSRASILYVKEGREDRVRAFFDKNYHGMFDVRDSKEMLREGYFGIGNIKRETHDRIGDLIALPRFFNAIDNSRVDQRHGLIPGRHGGLSEEEMHVPCIISKLA